MFRPHVRTIYWHLEVLFILCRALFLAPVHLNWDGRFAKQHFIELSDPKFIETYKILTFVKSNVRYSAKYEIFVGYGYLCKNHRRYCCVILINGSLLFDYISFSYIAFTVLYDTIRFSPYIQPYKIL